MKTGYKSNLSNLVSSVSKKKRKEGWVYSSEVQDFLALAKPGFKPPVQNHQTNKRRMYIRNSFTISKLC